MSACGVVGVVSPSIRGAPADSAPADAPPADGGVSYQLQASDVPYPNGVDFEEGHAYMSQELQQTHDGTYSGKEIEEDWASECLRSSDVLANEGVLQPHEKRIFLLRHGQGEHNVHDDPDLPDPPLTALGREQANSWAAQMPKIAQPEVVLLSPLTRTLQTGLRAFQNCRTRFEVCRHARELPFEDRCNWPNRDVIAVRRLLESEPRGREILTLDGQRSQSGIPGTGGLQEGFADLPETEWDSTLHGKADESRWLADRDRVHNASIGFLLKELCHRQETTIAVSAHYNTIYSIMWPQEVHTDNCELVEAVLNSQTGQLTRIQSHECPWVF